MSLDVINFEIEVQDLALQLSLLDEGRLPAGVLLSAQSIAETLNTDRSVFAREFPENLDSKLVGLLDNVIKHNPKNDPEFIEGIENLKRDEAETLARREKIGAWLQYVLPKMEKTLVKPTRVINSLLLHPELAFTEYDYDEVESILEAQEQTILELASVTQETDVSAEIVTPEILEEPNEVNLSEVADSLLKIMVQNNGQWRTKASIRSNEFRTALAEAGGADKKQERQLFHDAWDLLVAFYKEIDPSFELFVNDSAPTRGRKYRLDDPEMTLLFWQDDDDTTEGPEELKELEGRVDQADKKADTRGKIIDYQKGKILFEDGSNLLLETLGRQQAFYFLREQGFIGIKNLVQKVSDSTGLRRSEAEKEVRAMLAQLGDRVHRYYSSKRSKLILSLR